VPGARADRQQGGRDDPRVGRLLGTAYRHGNERPPRRRTVRRSQGMTATIWVGTSWKMNKTLADALAFADRLKAADAASHPNIQRFIIPPFTAVREVKARLAGTSVKVGAQNMHWDDAGAWTGEISPVMLKDCNVDLVEIGHSE